MTPQYGEKVDQGERENERHNAFNSDYNVVPAMAKGSTRTSIRPIPLSKLENLIRYLTINSKQDY